jgi:hypothetical protein
MQKLTRGIVSVIAGLALTLLGLVFAVPAQAASTVPITSSPATPDGTTAVTLTAKCADQGGVDYTVTLKYGYYYEDANGSLRAQAGPLTITRTDHLKIEDGVDFRLRGYSYHTSDGLLHKIQDLRFDGANLGSDNSLVLNPRNVLYRVGKSVIVVTGLGTDNDGLSSGTCARLEFFVPKLPFNADA